MAGLPDAEPTGEACVNARIAQLVAAAEIHESRWCGKPLFIVGWKGKARRATCQVPSSSWISSRNRSPRRQHSRHASADDHGMTATRGGRETRFADRVGSHCCFSNFVAEINTPFGHSAP